MAIQRDISEAFVKLGDFLRFFCEEHSTTPTKWSKTLELAVIEAGQKNGWFTADNVHFCLAQWGALLTRENLEVWTASYDLPKESNKVVAIIMAGNIPLVGFHDFLCVLLSGHSVLAKLASNDSVLLPFLAKFLIAQEPTLSKKIKFTKEQLQGFDAVIATGSNNTGRYFEYYFSKHPHIIRKNRNSIAVLSDNETKAELDALGQDIFRYFGLGCRSVSKLYVPSDYKLDTFFEGIFGHKNVINTHKYANNYDYNKAVFLMSDFEILDNGFLLLKEDTSMASPIGTLYYERYSALDSLNNKLAQEKKNLQCVVSSASINGASPFGSSQTPTLTDYADGVDTMQFLLNL
ncbi:MAG: acyl-CoA reductase [Croceitalea sp.]|nr:acyl-CoA reductase [Croceitalea sp.]